MQLIRLFESNNYLPIWKFGSLSSICQIYKTNLQTFTREHYIPAVTTLFFTANLGHLTAISLRVTYSKTSFLCVCVSVTLIYNCLFYILENILIQALKSSSETMTDPNVYHLEISDDRTYPTAYDACQTILEKEC